MLQDEIFYNTPLPLLSPLPVFTKALGQGERNLDKETRYLHAKTRNSLEIKQVRREEKYKEGIDS